MRAPVPDFLDESLAATITDNVTALLDDPQLTVEIEYRRAGKATYSTTDGTQTRTTGKWTFRAVQEQVKQTAKSSGRMGDQQFLFLKEEMPIDPRKGDEIRVGGNVWRVTSWDSDLQKLMWLVMTRRADA